ncbi:sensor histidine kinase [Paenibacillus sp. 598K]|uniref:cache domain-containing sensor histidine kinase n=1 Tax=Paenibacillus sp. 598K TaxID=1117987 RepID=UPI000FF95DBA|nr:sensor histidine kinase [Paenibacillus sp. 598K]GBF77843.1 sensor histidine kinase [Paenibacillus sp. 598K]
MRRLSARLRDWFRSNIQVRLTCYFLLILLPLVVISLFAIERSRDILYQQAEQRTTVALASTMDYIDLALQNVEELSAVIAADPSIVERLNANGAYLPPTAIVDFSAVLKQLSNLKAVNRFSSQIALYHQASHMLISTSFGGRRVLSEPQQAWLLELARTGGTGVRYMLPQTPVASDATFGEMLGTDTLTLVRSMDLYNTERQFDLLLIAINKNSLQHVLRTLVPSANTRITLLNEQGDVIAASGSDDAAATPLSDEEMEVAFDSEYSMWQLRLVQPKSELYEESDQLRLFTYTIIAISVLLAFVIAWVVYSGIASPLTKLSRGMKQIGSGQLDIRLDNKRRDEFGVLLDAFNQMATEQKHLIEDHYEQQLRMKTTELKFLQSQINPHFLYNTLDSIYWMAKSCDSAEISEMVMQLSRFFRLSLNKGQEEFALEESLSHLHYYIRIQQLRFMDNFTVVYDTAEETKPIPLLKLLLQPLVENAILHGLEGRESGGVLRIASRIQGAELRIGVADNGAGISPERLHYIREELRRMERRSITSLSRDEETATDLFGLRNVYTRMRLYYGEGATMTIDSAAGEGTRIEIAIPLQGGAPTRASYRQKKEGEGSDELDDRRG